MYTCPVCFFDGLRYPPADYTICPCCYTEFGLDDAEMSREQLRSQWIENGMPWMATNITPPPPGWNPYTQLTNLDVPVTEDAVFRITDIGEKVVEVLDMPRAIIRIHWQIITHSGEAWVAPA